MQSPQNKKFIVNIVLVIILASIAGAGYWIFNTYYSTNNERVDAPTTGVEALEIGIEIARTLRELEDLERAVASSKSIFDMPSFKSLEDLSVAISPEPIVVRENPFVSTVKK